LRVDALRRILTLVHVVEQLGDLRVVHRLTRGIDEQVLLGHIGHIVGLGVLGEQMVEGLVLGFGRISSGNGFVPFVRIGEFRDRRRRSRPETETSGA
jgi:hypothetical protein